VCCTKESMVREDCCFIALPNFEAHITNKHVYMSTLMLWHTLAGTMLHGLLHEHKYLDELLQ